MAPLSPGAGSPAFSSCFARAVAPWWGSGGPRRLMPESYRPIREILAAAKALKRSDTPVLSLGGTAHDPAVNRSGASTDQQIVQLWLDSKRSRHTRRAYARDILLFNDFLAKLPKHGVPPHVERLGDITVLHLEEFLKHQIRSDPPRTAARRLSAVKSLLTFAQQTGYLHFNVGSIVKLPIFADDMSERILSESEVQLCIYSAQEGRNRTLLRFLYYTACRVEECVGVRWTHLSDRDDRCIVRLFGKGGRTRHVPVPLTIRAHMDEIRRFNMSGFVFETRGGNPMNPKDVWRVVHSAAKTAGLAHKVHPHCFRHSHASHALRRGADIRVVQSTLGHTNIRTTAGYLHLELGEGSAMYLDTSID